MKPRLIFGLALAGVAIVAAGCSGSGGSTGQASSGSTGTPTGGVQEGVDVNTLTGPSSEGSSIPISMAFVGTMPANFSGDQGLGSKGQFHDGAPSQERQADNIVDLSFRFTNRGSTVLSGHTPAQIFVKTSLGQTIQLPDPYSGQALDPAVPDLLPGDQVTVTTTGAQWVAIAPGDSIAKVTVVPFVGAAEPYPTWNVDIPGSPSWCDQAGNPGEWCQVEAVPSTAPPGTAPTTTVTTSTTPPVTAATAPSAVTAPTAPSAPPAPTTP